MDFIYLTYFIFLSKFLIFWICFYLLGRSFLLVINYFLKSERRLDEVLIINTPIHFFYPIAGLFLLGNVLFISHFFLPLKSPVLYIIFFILLVPNFIEKIKIPSSDNKFFNFFYYIFVPIILLFSSYDINFHYDAGFYHLNHQLWLRESNQIIGMVNIFWPFGTDSIYEYISAFLWFDQSFILLHFINLIFVICFYGFSAYHLFVSKDSLLKYPSLFIMIFSIFDNFGIDGGRNGFFYIQSVTAQDLPVAVMFYLVSLMLVQALSKNSFSKIEYHLFLIFIVFLIQIKLSVVFVGILLIIHVINLIKKKHTTISILFKNTYVYLFLFTLWTIKSVLVSGCLIFPLNITCFNNIGWYIENSTKKYERISTSYSMAYDFQEPVAIWFSSIINDEIRRTVLLNFLASLLIILLLRKILFIKKDKIVFVKKIINYYIFFNLTYFIFAGPTPRYGIGLIMFSIAVLGINLKLKNYENLEKKLFIPIVILSVLSVPRLASYRSFDFNFNPSLVVPDVAYINTFQNWVEPETGDKCWINIDCTVDTGEIRILDDGFFKVVSRNTQS